MEIWAESSQELGLGRANGCGAVSKTETGRQTERETYKETRSDSVKKSKLTTGRGDGSIGASPGVLSEMEWARLC